MRVERARSRELCYTSPVSQSFDAIVAAAFSSGPAFQANELIAEAREAIRAEHGWAVQVELILSGRGWEYLVGVAAPRLALYLRSKKLSVASCGPAFVSVFLGETLHFLHARDLFEVIRVASALSEEAFAALAEVWERTGRPPAPLAALRARDGGGET